MNQRSGFWGKLLILIALVIPIIIWITMQPLGGRFSNFNTAMRSLGQISALEGMVLFSVSFLLNTRLNLVEKYFGGLDRMYVTHHNLGAVAFILLLFHPLFLASQYLTLSVRSAALLLLPGNDFSINLGIFGLLFMFAFIFITFFSKFRYQRWKFIHQLLGVAFLIGSWHVLIISSDTSRSLPLKIYMTLFIILGAGAYGYRTLFSRWIIRKHRYTVKSVKKLGEITELELEPESEREKINCSAGQFVFMNFNQEMMSREQHPFSISSCPGKKNLILSIKSLGDFTSGISGTRIGSRVEIEGPYGHFKFDFSKNPQIWIAGGIGITPFLSRIREGFGENVDLYYAVRNKKDAVFLSELKDFEKKNKNFRLFERYSDETGYLDVGDIEKNSGLKEKDIFICGPPAMMFSLIEKFIKHGVKKQKIYYERFNLK